MSTIRTGNHWRVTIVDDGTQPPDASGHRPDARLLAVVMAGKVLTTDPELAERVARLLNADQATEDAIDGWLAPRCTAEAPATIRKPREDAPSGPDGAKPWECKLVREHNPQTDPCDCRVWQFCAMGHSLDDAPSARAVEPPAAQNASGVPASTPDAHSDAEGRFWGEHPAHPTCVDVSRFSEPPRSQWKCGRDCPQPERKADQP